jgi:hypothetical protein
MVTLSATPAVLAARRASWWWVDGMLGDGLPPFENADRVARGHHFAGRFRTVLTERS